jgi:hypothetical protein
MSIAVRLNFVSFCGIWREQPRPVIRSVATTAVPAVSIRPVTPTSTGSLTPDGRSIPLSVDCLGPVEAVRILRNRSPVTPITTAEVFGIWDCREVLFHVDEPGPAQRRRESLGSQLWGARACLSRPGSFGESVSSFEWRADRRVENRRVEFASIALGGRAGYEGWFVVWPVSALWVWSMVAAQLASRFSPS